MERLQADAHAGSARLVDVGRITAVSPTGTGRLKSILSMLAVTQVSPSMGNANVAPTPSIHFMMLPP